MPSFLSSLGCFHSQCLARPIGLPPGKANWGCAPIYFTIATNCSRALRICIGAYGVLPRRLREKRCSAIGGLSLAGA